MVPLCRLRESLGSKVEVLESKGTLEQKTLMWGVRKVRTFCKTEKKGK